MVAANFLQIKSAPPLSKIVLCQQTIALKAHCSLKPLFPSRNLLENETFLDFLSACSGKNVMIAETCRKELGGLFSKDLSGPLKMTLAAISNLITFARN